MLITIEVERHSREEDYFSPWFDQHEHGLHIHFHGDDITDDGARAIKDLLDEQVRLRWRPRPPGTPRGPRIPSVLRRCSDMPETAAACDCAEGIVYLLSAELITERGAQGFVRAQADVIPNWERLPRREDED